MSVHLSKFKTHKTFQIVKSVCNTFFFSVISGKKVQKSTEKTWLEQFPWLEIGDAHGKDTKLMFCSFCKKHNKSNSMATKGSPNLQISTIKVHEQSVDHRDAVRISRQLKRAHSSLEFEDVYFDVNNNDSKSSPSVSESDKIVFRTVFFLCKIRTTK